MSTNTAKYAFTCEYTLAAARSATDHMDLGTLRWFHGITGAQCDVNLRGARVDSRGSLADAAVNNSNYRRPRKSVNTPERTRVGKVYQGWLKSQNQTSSVKAPVQGRCNGYQCI